VTIRLIYENVRFRSQSVFDCIHGFDKGDPAHALASRSQAER